MQSKVQSSIIMDEAYILRIHKTKTYIVPQAMRFATYNTFYYTQYYFISRVPSVFLLLCLALCPPLFRILRLCLWYALCLFVLCTYTTLVVRRNNIKKKLKPQCSFVILAWLSSDTSTRKRHWNSVIKIKYKPHLYLISNSNEHTKTAREHIYSEREGERETDYIKYCWTIHSEALVKLVHLVALTVFNRIYGMPSIPPICIFGTLTII